ncbi:MAG: ferric reductase-like transmembrane domain-containing protein [Candidatus Saccharimonas sp.]
MADRDTHWYLRLLGNSRFWILASAVVVSVNIAGFSQFLIPPGSLQIIRIEQIYGFLALILLYLAILASPLTKVVPKLPGKEAYLHARRAIGVSAFYFAFLHAYISFFQQLNGFGGIKYFNQTFSLSLAGGVFALSILFIMAATSFDWVVDRMGYKHWKLLHRLVYFASIAVLIHIVLIGTHYGKDFSWPSILTLIAVVFLIVLEVVRILTNIVNKKRETSND